MSRPPESPEGSDVRLHIRITRDEFVGLRQCSIMQSKSMARVLLDYFADGVMANPDIPKGILDGIAKLRKFRELAQKRIDSREKFRMMYHPHNTMTRILRMASSSRSRMGEINMSVIHAVIDESKEQYDLFPDDMKSTLKNEMSEIERCRDAEFLNDRLQHSLKNMAIAYDVSKRGKRKNS